MQHIRKSVLYSLITAFSLALFACAPPVVIKEPEPLQPELAQELDRARQLEEAGDFAAAASIFQDLASKTQPPLSQDFLLLAIEAFIQAESLPEAYALVGQLDDARLSDEQSMRKRLVAAEIALRQGQVMQALRMLEEPPDSSISLELRLRFHRDRAESFRLAGNLLESARELGEIDSLLISPEARLENQIVLVQTLTTLTDTALELLQPPPPSALRGWMAMARLIKEHAQDPLAIQPLLAVWREEFPEHPALPELLDSYFERIKAQYQRVEHLAVLLPQSGRFALAAAALRDGLLAAYFNQADEHRPVLRFYDSSNATNAWPLYRQAIEEGADMIIGPLSKESVVQFARAGELEVPVLALNQVVPEVTPPEDLYQFGLAPEDEARQAAERAWLDGYSRALVLVPEGTWGERLHTSFRERFETLGGLVSEHQSYVPKEHDFSDPIQALLNIDESRARRGELQQLVRRNLEFEPRRRQDVDFIFLAAGHQIARQIRPQLQFHHALGLPVFATSHIFTGSVDRQKDQDLEGLMFPDIPWLLAEDPKHPLSRQRLLETLGNVVSGYTRLYAMGIDSYNLLPHLLRLKASPHETFEGKTGSLYLDRINQVHRRLVWAQMHKGQPEIIGYAPRLEAGSFEEPAVLNIRVSPSQQNGSNGLEGEEPDSTESRQPEQ